MRKKCKVLLLMLCCAIWMCAVPVCAMERGTGIAQMISPYALYISSASAKLSIGSDGSAQIETKLFGTSSVTKVSITAKLQQYKNGSWSTIKTFTKSKDSTSVTLSDTYPVTKGYTYRVQSTVTAYCGGASETRTVMSSEVKY